VAFNLKSLESRAMAEFLSSSDYSRFAYSVTQKARFVHEEEVRQFLATVVSSSEARRDSIAKGTILWRAQRGHEWRMENSGEEGEFEVPCAFSPDRMVPKAEFAGDGRVNPKGIPCLYLSTTSETAMAEVRPWVGSSLSLAQFKVMRDLTLVNCSLDKKTFIVCVIDGEPKELPTWQREQVVWGDIGYAFSRPITPDHPATEYVPTQILAEAFRSHGYDGIMYKSLLGDGLNIAVFNCDAAELINCRLYETKSVSFKFEPGDNPYFISKHYPKLQTDDPSKSEPDSP
jgi:RES domain